MRVAHLTNMWPDDRRPFWGAFVKAQVDSLAPFGVESVVRLVDGQASAINYLKAAAGVGRLARDRSFDLVHAHYGLTGVVAAMQRRLPIVLSLYGSDVNTSWQRPLSVAAALRARRTIVCSSRMAARLPAALHPIVLPPGIDTAHFTQRNRDEARRRLGLGARSPVLLFGASPDRPIKDFPLFEAAVSRLGIPDTQIATMGAVADEDLPFLYSAADCLLLTSRAEGSPTVVKEALACGCPVVSVDVGDVGEQIAGDTSSRLVQSRDPGALATAVRDVLASGRRADTAHVAERFSLQGVARRLVTIYAEAVGH